MGSGCHIYPKVQIWAPWNLLISDEVGVGDGSTLYSMARIELGRRVVISQGAHLCAGTHDYENPNFRLLAAPITVGAESWLCAECFIGPGVTVGEGCVVGARGVVVKNIPEWTVWAGNPARMVKKRSMRESNPQERELPHS